MIGENFDKILRLSALWEGSAMELNRAVAGNIRRIRKSKKLSLEQTAALSGVSRSMLGQIERGEANPSVAILGKIGPGSVTAAR